MVESGSLLIAAAMYAVTAVARKASDELLDSVWKRLKESLHRVLGREPKTSDVTQGQLEAAFAREPELRLAVSRVWQGTQVLRRAKLVNAALAGSRILWIDDHPEDNMLERECLSALGARLVVADTTRSALACLGEATFELIISDIDRADSPTEGVDALARIRASAPGTPVVFYVMSLDRRSTPFGSFGITNRPDELLHLCMDVLERVRL